MSFSSEVKEELFEHIGKSRHCQLAELAALISWEGEHSLLDEKKYEIYRRLFDTECIDATAMKKMYEAVRMWDEERQIPVEVESVDGLLLQQSCCKRAFIRGAFLAIGSISAPEKGYHLEFVTANEKKAKQLQEMIQSFGIEAKTILRKKYHVVYMKESEAIVDVLNIMEAHVALMKLENLRILKELRNTVNRRVNCETANINKTLDSSRKQQEDILLLKEKYGLENLPKGLQQIAQIRLEEPEASLKELGEMLEPPIGKSGVNHRLRKLSELADKLRCSKEEEKK
jgi:DNA-binding protein WhiA